LTVSKLIIQGERSLTHRYISKWIFCWFTNQNNNKKETKKKKRKKRNRECFIHSISIFSSSSILRSY